VTEPTADHGAGDAGAYFLWAWVGAYLRRARRSRRDADGPGVVLRNEPPAIAESAAEGSGREGDAHEIAHMVADGGSLPPRSRPPRSARRNAAKRGQAAEVPATSIAIIIGSGNQPHSCLAGGSQRKFVWKPPGLGTCRGVTVRFWMRSLDATGRDRRQPRKTSDQVAGAATR